MKKIAEITRTQELAKEYSNATPFPHIVLKDIFDENVLDVARTEVENFSLWEGEKNFYGSQHKRWQSDYEKLPTTVKQVFDYLNSSGFLKILEEITGEVGLIPDPYLSGGGIHSTGKSGFLKLHADFNWHEKLKAYRRLNILVYLNKNWLDEWNGNLELAMKQDGGELKIVKSVRPHFNTTVIFTTDDHSFHGQSDPLNIPEGTRRNSLAAYYYILQKPQGSSELKRLSTDYRFIDGKKMKGASVLSRYLQKIKKHFL